MDIQHNIPISPEAPTLASEIPFADMQIGDSVLLTDEKKSQKVEDEINQHLKRPTDFLAICRKEKDGVRVWKVSVEEWQSLHFSHDVLAIVGSLQERIDQAGKINHSVLCRQRLKDLPGSLNQRIKYLKVFNGVFWQSVKGENGGVSYQLID